MMFHRANCPCTGCGRAEDDELRKRDDAIRTMPAIAEECLDDILCAVTVDACHEADYDGSDDLTAEGLRAIIDACNGRLAKIERSAA